MPWMSREVKNALEHVRHFFPEVTCVMYTRSLKWVYMDDDGEAPNFAGSHIDPNILQKAADSLCGEVDFPVAYSIKE
jgi:hypothetical protein